MLRTLYIVMVSLALTLSGYAKDPSTSEVECLKKELLSILTLGHYTSAHAEAMIKQCSEIEPLQVAALEPLSQRLVRVTYCAQRPSTSFIFVCLDTGGCLPLSGDFNDFLRAPWTHADQRAFLLSNFNQAVANFPQPIRDKPQIIEYVSSVLGLLYPSATLKVISGPEEVWTGSDKRAFPRERWLSKKVATAIVAPTVTRVNDKLYQGSFFLWSNLGGWLEEVRFFYWTDGRVSFQEAVHATKVGPFEKEYLGRM